MRFTKSISCLLLSLSVVLFSACKEEEIEPAPQPKPCFDVKFTGVTQFELTANITPADSVEQYVFLILEEGEEQKQLDQFGAMMGITKLEDYIIAISQRTISEGEVEFKFTKMKPATKYILYIVPLDSDGKQTYAMENFECSTLVLGGSGEASVSVSLGDFTGEYKVDDAGNHIKDPVTGADSVNYYQVVTVTPNDQAALFRFLLIITDSIKADGDKSAAAYYEYLCLEEDPDYAAQGMENPYWSLYQTDVWAWNLFDNTGYSVLAVAKNADGKYSELIKYDFKTPEGSTVTPTEPGAPIGLSMRKMVSNVVDNK